MKEKLMIMIVEDHPINLKLVTDLLQIAGFEVCSSMDAAGALNLLRDIHPDAILMDVGLPDMSGLELTRIIKADDRTGNIKIIALTAFAMTSDKEKVIEVGCDGYITKPIETRKFVNQVLEILNQP